jgi:hypothetical protein
MSYATSILIFALMTYASANADFSFSNNLLNGNEIDKGCINRTTFSKFINKNPDQLKILNHASHQLLAFHNRYTKNEDNTVSKSDYIRFYSKYDYYSTPNSRSKKKTCINSIQWQSTQPVPYKIIYDSKSELIMLQWKGLNEEDRDIRLTDMRSKTIMKTTLLTGSTIAYFDTQTLHEGSYYVEVFQNEKWIKNKITITK